VTVGEDGRVTVVVGSPSTGQSHATVFAQIVADRLGVDISKISVRGGDTAAVNGTGTFASRMTVDGGNAVALAAGEVRRKLLDVASNLLEVSPEDLEIVGGVISVKGFGERQVGVAEVTREAQERGVELTATSQYEPEQTSAWAGGVNVSVVEVDPETGHVTVLRHVVVHDSGVLVNPAEVEGQIQGGVAHGLGNVLLEGAIYDESGQLVTSTFADYLIPAFGTVPEVEMVHRMSPSPFNPEGVKGAGESGTIGAIPALARAIEDALAPFGIQIEDMPVRSEDIAMHIRERAVG
jgi:carbon-monoxide dehydrogenase large subunit